MKLIAGIIPNEEPAKVRFWEWNYEFEPRIGNYAVAESRKEYVLVKIVAKVEADEPKILTGHKVRKAVLSIPTYLLTGEYLIKEEDTKYKPISYMDIEQLLSEE